MEMRVMLEKIPQASKSATCKIGMMCHEVIQLPDVAQQGAAHIRIIQFGKDNFIHAI